MEWFVYIGTKKMKLFDIFPCPIFGTQYPEHQCLKKKVLEIVETHIDDFEENISSKNLLHFKNRLDQSILYDPIFSDFKIWLEDMCYNYITSLLGYELPDKVIVTDSWLNKCNAGGEQMAHYHSNSFVSGTYYLNFDPEKHSPIMFNKKSTLSHPHQPSISLLQKEDFITKYNSDSIVYPEEGEVYLWESHMSHSVPKNLADNRITLSMNFMPTVVSNSRYGFKVRYT